MPKYRYLDDTPHLFTDLGRILEPGEEFEHESEIVHGLVHKLDVPPEQCAHCVPPAPNLEPAPSVTPISAESPEPTARILTLPNAED